MIGGGKEEENMIALPPPLSCKWSVSVEGDSQEKKIKFLRISTDTGTVYGNCSWYMI